MGFPSDITNLITWYLLKPKYTWSKFAKFNKKIIRQVDKLNAEELYYLCKNPCAHSILKAHIDYLIKCSIRTDLFYIPIMGLVDNHNSDSLELIRRFDNWVDLIKSLHISQNIFSTLIDNYTSSKLIDEFIESIEEPEKVLILPQYSSMGRNCFISRIMKSPACANIILSGKIDNIIEEFEEWKYWILSNPDDRIVEKYMIDCLEKSDDRLRYLSSNTNIKVLEKIENAQWFNSSFDYSNLEPSDQHIISILGNNLIANPSPHAEILLRKLIINSGYNINFLVSSIRYSSLGNCSEFIIDLLSEHEYMVNYSDIEKRIYELESNRNIKAIELLYKHGLLPIDSEKLEENPAFIQFMESHPEFTYRLDSCPAIYSNPGMFSQIPKLKLARKITYLFYKN